MNEKKIPPYGIVPATRTQNHSEIDYVDGNTIVKGSGAASVMVAAQSDLSKLGDYPPGTIAFTAGYGSMWQKKADGTWADI